MGKLTTNPGHSLPGAHANQTYTIDRPLYVSVSRACVSAREDGVAATALRRRVGPCGGSGTAAAAAGGAALRGANVGDAVRAARDVPSANFSR